MRNVELSTFTVVAVTVERLVQTVRIVLNLLNVV